MTGGLLSKRMDDARPRNQSLKIPDALKEVILQSYKQDRLIQGVLETSRVLRRSPKEVMFVVVERATHDKKESEIQEKLIQAYCTENRVKCFKVNRCSTLLRSLQERSSENSSEERESDPIKHTIDSCLHKCSQQQSEDICTDPVQCILVRQPEVPSKEDKFLSAFYETLVSNNLTSCPYIRC